MTDSEIERLWWIGEQSTDVVLREFAKEKDRFDQTDAVVPAKPNERTVEDFLLTVRRDMW